MLENRLFFCGTRTTRSMNTLQSTIGVDFSQSCSEGREKNKVDNMGYSGPRAISTLTSAYYRAQGIILTYDVTRRETFEALNVWLQEVDKLTSPGGGANVVKLLVGNKIDKKPRAVSRREGESLCKRHVIFRE